MPSPYAARLAQIEWWHVAQGLDADGWARLGALLTRRECDTIAAWFERDARCRSTVDMARHGFGRGTYRYFAEPVPAPIAALRRALYARLAPIANAWAEALGEAARYPPRFVAFQAQCRAAGQTRPTPLLLRYRPGDYNCLHQDRYGDIAFPLQVVVPLSRPGADYSGGELLFVEQRPRGQSRGSAVTPAAGEGVAFANAARPLRGRRGFYRVQLRHGVSVLTAGERLALGIIFHDAR